MGSEEASGPSNEAVPGPDTEQIVPTDTSSQHSNRQHTATFTDAGQLPDETSRGMQVSDILIMLLVAAIGAILFRRINLLQESEGGLENHNEVVFDDYCHSSLLLCFVKICDFGA